MKRTTILAILVLAMVLSACQAVAPDPATEADGPRTVTLAAHDTFNISEEIIEEFERENNATLQVLALGDAGEGLNKIILSKDAPLADVFYGVDNTFFSRAIESDAFVPYESPMLSEIPDELKLDDESRLLPVDFGFVNINADKEWFDEAGLAIPETLEQLTEQEYENLLVVENPATSSPGLAFLLTTIGHFGEDGYLDYWQALKENGVLITAGWNEAYYEEYTAGSVGIGERPLVVSYSTSPPVEVVYATDGRTEPASVNVMPANGTFRQIEFVGLLNNAGEPELGKALIDLMLSKRFQDDIPLQMYVYPANETAELPQLFLDFGQTPSDPVQVSPARIDEMREQWINEWTDLMLR